MLKINDLNVSYGASQVLFGVDLQANLGEISCVLGRNGVGKTSLVRAVAGRHFATSGQVLWEGEYIRDRDPASRARQGVAYVPQGREIFARLTVQENLEVAFAAAPIDQRFIPKEILSYFQFSNKCWDAGAATYWRPTATTGYREDTLTRQIAVG